MKTSVLILAGALVASATAASAQSAAENFSYKAPSGMFSEGTTKWQHFKFIHEDAERRAKQAAVPAPRRDVIVSGSVASRTRYSTLPAQQD